MDRLQAAEQFRRVMQMFAASLSDEKAMEVASVYDPWQSGRSYATGDLFTHGTNAVGDPQLYRVVMNHTAHTAWPPDSSPSMYVAIGLDLHGYPIWSQPAGEHDAYSAGDIVNYNGSLYKSLIAGNTYAPDVYPAGWEAL